MLASYHNHTPRCRHASGSEESYVLHAIKYGYEIFGFSDHSPHLFKDILSDSRMSADELPLYVSDIRALREKYQNHIEIKIGLEHEYYPTTHKKDMQFYKACGIEYLILGQHTIGTGTENDHINSFAKTPENNSYTLYVNQCIEALSTGDFCYFAHPDVFHYDGDRDFYKSESDRLIRAAMSYGVPLEVNMFGMVDNRHYPNDLFWERAGILGAEVVLGRDAHKIERVHCESEFYEAYKFIDKYNLNLLEEIKTGAFK